MGDAYEIKLRLYPREIVLGPPVAIPWEPVYLLQQLTPTKALYNVLTDLRFQSEPEVFTVVTDADPGDEDDEASLPRRRLGLDCPILIAEDLLAKLRAATRYSIHHGEPTDAAQRQYEAALSLRASLLAESDAP